MVNAVVLGPDVPFPCPEKHWMNKHKYLVGLTTQARNKPPLDLYFLGDSLTEFWPELGGGVWRAEFGKLHVLNGGVSGDTTQNILYRITNGEFDRIAPRVVVLLAGINNLGGSPDLPPADLARGIGRILSTLQLKSPKSKILLLSIFPCGDPGDAIRERVRATNRLLAGFADQKTVTYLDLYDTFLDRKGEFSPAISPDGLHLNARGYQIWADAMRPALQKLLEE